MHKLLGYKCSNQIFPYLINAISNCVNNKKIGKLALPHENNETKNHSSANINIELE